MAKNGFPLCFEEDEGALQTGFLEGNWSVAYFSDAEFDEFSFMSFGQISKLVAQRLFHHNGLNFDAGLSLGPNGERNVAIWEHFSQPWSVDVYTFRNQEGTYPNRFQHNPSYSLKLGRFMSP